MIKGIGFVGPLGSGKTTLASMIVTKLRETRAAELGSLGKGIKEHCAQLKYNDAPNRELWQFFGQACRAIFGEDVWIQNLKKQMLPDCFYCVDDIRQPNEVEFFKKEGFLIVGLVCAENIRLERVERRDGYSQAGNLSHETEINAEKLVLDAHLKYHNSGPIEALSGLAEDIVLGDFTQTPGEFVQSLLSHRPKTSILGKRG